MSEADLAEPKVSAFSLIDDFILVAQQIEFNPCDTAQSREAEDYLFDLVGKAARHSGTPKREAYNNVAGYIALQKGLSKENLLKSWDSALGGIVRRVGYRCGESAPGWACTHG